MSMERADMGPAEIVAVHHTRSIPSCGPLQQSFGGYDVSSDKFFKLVPSRIFFV